MSSISLTKCDGIGCDNQIDHNKTMNPTYIRLDLGGSDFEMSFGEQSLDYCSLECLHGVVSSMWDAEVKEKTKKLMHLIEYEKFSLAVEEYNDLCKESASIRREVVKMVTTEAPIEFLDIIKGDE